MNLKSIHYIHEIGAKKTQEDYIWPVPGAASPDDRIFIVCDGVGGSENGEIASRIVAEYIGTTLLKTNTPSKAKPAEINNTFINQLLDEARLKLVEYARLHQLSTDMATTFTLLLYSNEKAFVAWCGDSRVYHIRDGEILFRTDDHSLVSSLVRSGEITEEEAKEHPRKNIILKAIRSDDTRPEADSRWIEDIQEGDYFMLCTDGLLENIGHRELLFLLKQNDKGDIDLVQSFQQFCYDKTKDNYSMYLTKVSTERKKIASKRKIRWLAFLLILLIAAAAFIIKEIYFTGKKTVNALIPVGIPVKSYDSIEKKDSPAPAIKTIKDTIVKITALLPAKSVKDSIKPGKILTPVKYRDSLKQKTDTIKRSKKPLKATVKTDSAEQAAQPLN